MLVVLTPSDRVLGGSRAPSLSRNTRSPEQYACTRAQLHRSGVGEASPMRALWCTSQPRALVSRSLRRGHGNTADRSSRHRRMGCSRHSNVDMRTGQSGSDVLAGSPGAWFFVQSERHGILSRSTRGEYFCATSVTSCSSPSASVIGSRPRSRS